MKNFDEFVSEIRKKTENARRKHKKSLILKSVVSVACAGVIIFLVAFSNIPHIDFYANSYLNYLFPYVSANEQVGVKLVDDKNAVVLMNGEPHACFLDAQSSKKFELTPTDKSTTAARSISLLPPVFELEFWDKEARISWTINGVKIEEILSITEEKGVHEGIWIDFAYQNGDSEPTVSQVGGKLWTVIEENGDAYTGEGTQIGVSKFISIGDLTFNAMFDTASGLLTELLTFEYDEQTFDFPTLKQASIFDGEQPTSYSYYRRLSEAEKVDFEGDIFNAGGVIKSVQSSSLPDLQQPFTKSAKWRLSEFESKSEHLLNLSANLNLRADGSAQLRVTDGGVLNGKTDGKWYAMHDWILVVLDEESNLCGRAFIVYPDGGEGSVREIYQKKARSTYKQFSLYKTGYHTFNYYLLYENYDIFWGTDFDVNEYLPRPLELYFDVPYVLEGSYLKEYYEGEYIPSDAEIPPFSPLPWNGQMSITFLSEGMTKEEEKHIGSNYVQYKVYGKAKVSYPTGEETVLSYKVEFSNYTEKVTIWFSQKIYLYKTDGYYVRAKADHLISSTGLFVSGNYFDCVFKPVK